MAATEDDSNNDNANSSSFDLSMNSRRISQDDSSNEEVSFIPEITAEEIERLMMFDMMRQNFKNESDLSSFD